eukprot:2706275-Prymnesium_polylepis.1
MVPRVSRSREHVREQHGEGNDDAVKFCGNESSLAGVACAVVEQVTEILNDTGTKDVLSTRPLGAHHLHGMGRDSDEMIELFDGGRAVRTRLQNALAKHEHRELVDAVLQEADIERGRDITTLLSAQAPAHTSKASVASYAPLHDGYDAQTNADPKITPRAVFATSTLQLSRRKFLVLPCIALSRYRICQIATQHKLNKQKNHKNMGLLREWWTASMHEAAQINRPKKQNSRMLLMSPGV